MKKDKIYTFLSLAFTTATVIHIGNRYISYHSDLKNVLSLTNCSYYNWKYGRIFYTIKGNGKPLLLLHDLESGGSAYEWNRVEEKLAENHTVYSVDLPGCGRSEKNSMIYTNFLFVQMVTSFVKDVIRTRTDVITSGYSAAIVAMANVYDRNCFDKVIFVNPTSLRTLEKNVTFRSKLYKKIVDLPVFGTAIYNMHVSHESISNLFINRYFNNPFRVDRDILDAYYEAAHKGRYNCKFLYTSLAGGYLYGNNIKNAIQRIDENTVILSGECEKNKDKIVKQYIRENPSIRTAQIYGTRHLPHIEKPEEFSETVLSYLS